MKRSAGEKYIGDILNKEGVNYAIEKRFPKLRGGKYRFDFYLPKENILIEYDGEQHFKQVKKFQKTKKDFLNQQSHDRQKNSFALAYNIPLYRIPYWELKKIKNLKELLSDKFLVKSRWHNDDIWEEKNK